MEQLVNGTDPQQVVFTSMEDFCMYGERRMVSPAQSIISSTASGGLDRNVSPSIDSFYSTSRNSTVSGATGLYGHQRQIMPANAIFQNTSPIHARPPVPRQPGFYGNCLMI